MHIKTQELETPRGKLIFPIQSGKTVRRATRLLEKEPETIQWVEQMPPSSVFWDVGANTGGFSLYAALDPNIRVVAVEPGAVNHYLLALSAEMNGLAGRIDTYCIGFDDHTHAQSLAVSQLMPASSFRMSGAHDAERFGSQQALLCFSIDDFLGWFEVPAPTHLKIDVPNMPQAVLRGGANTLADGPTTDILVELDSACFEPGDLQRLLDWLAELGFRQMWRSEKKNPTLSDYLFRR